MQQIALSLENYQPQKVSFRSERDEIVFNITERINSDREANHWRYKANGKWKKTYPVTLKGIAMKVRHVSTEDLRVFHAECKQARCYSEWFFGRLKMI